MAQRLQGSPDLYSRPRADRLGQLHHLPRRLHARTTWSPTTASTTRPTARTTATAPTTTTAGTAAGKGRPTIPAINALAPAADQERRGHAAGQPGRAHAAHGRRGGPDPARQQQHLLPGQRAELARLAAAARPTPSCSASSSTASPSARPTRRCGAAVHLGNADGEGIDLSWHGTRAWHADWSADDRTLAFMLRGPATRPGARGRRPHLRGHEHALGSKLV